jgi:hypothetical protein
VSDAFLLIAAGLLVFFAGRAVAILYDIRHELVTLLQLVRDRR